MRNKVNRTQVCLWHCYLPWDYTNITLLPPSPPPIIYLQNACNNISSELMLYSWVGIHICLYILQLEIQSSLGALLIKWTLYNNAVYLSSFAFPNGFWTWQAGLATFDGWIEEVLNSYSAVGDLHEDRRQQQRPLLRERLQKEISSSLLSQVRENTVQLRTRHRTHCLLPIR